MNNLYRCFVIFCLCFSCSCSCSSSLKTSSNKRDIYKVNVYHIDQFKTFLISLNCEDVKKQFEDEFVFKDKVEIKDFEKLILYIENLTIDSIIETDPRVTIDFYDKESQLLHQFCWSMAGFSLDGKHYKNSRYVNSFLRKKKIIIEIVD